MPGLEDLIRPQVPRIDPARLQGGQSLLTRLLSSPGVQQGLIGTGTALLAQSDQPGTLGGALGRALPVGIQAGRRATRVQEFEQMLEGLPAPTQMALRLLGTKRGGELLASSMLAPPPEAEAEPTLVREFEFAQRNGFEGSFTDFIEAKKARPDTTTVNVTPGQAPNPVEEAQQERVAGLLTDGFESASGSIDRIETLDRLIEVTGREAFQRVSGPIEGRIGAARARFSGDNEALQALSEFRVGSGLLTMDQLEQFTGPKTDFEFQQAQRLAFSDETMTPEEIQAGLRGHKKVAEDLAKQWAERVLSVDPSDPLVGFDTARFSDQLDLARSIRDRFGNTTAGSIYLKYPNLRPPGG